MTLAPPNKNSYINPSAQFQLTKNGGFVLAYCVTNTTSNYTEVSLFNDEGELTKTLSVTDTLYDDVMKPKVAGLSSGGFVVAWI